MRVRTPILVLALATVAAVSRSAGSAEAGASRWEIRDLGALPGRCEAVAVNERGWIAGACRRPREQHAFLWQRGKVHDLGAVGRDSAGDMPYVVDLNERGQVLGHRTREGDDPQLAPLTRPFLWQGGRVAAVTPEWRSAAHALNDRGQVAGYRDLGNGAGRAFLWQNGKLRELGALPGRRHSWAYALNDRGQVVGESATIAARTGEPLRARAFLWQNGRMTDLGALPVAAESFSAATAVNEHGQVVGTSHDRWGVEPGRAFLWQNGRLTDLGTLGGATTAIAINDRGQVIGWSTTPSGDQHAFIWENGLMTDLETLGGRRSAATAINERGQVVGWSETRTKTRHAVLWEGGRILDLGTLGGSQSYATGINGRGRIVGAATTKGGRVHPVTWTRRRD